MKSKPFFEILLEVSGRSGLVLFWFFLGSYYAAKPIWAMFGMLGGLVLGLPYFIYLSTGERRKEIYVQKN